MNHSSRKHIGISGLAAYVPPYRVWLEDWCEWTGGHWPKLQEVVGRSFRMRGPNHSVYTMAATAVACRLAHAFRIITTVAMAAAYRRARACLRTTTAERVNAFLRTRVLPTTMTVATAAA